MAGAIVVSVVLSLVIGAVAGACVLGSLLRYLDATPLAWFKGHDHGVCSQHHPDVYDRVAELEALARIDAGALQAFGALRRQRRGLERYGRRP
jgi:hypothetical protein